MITFPAAFLTLCPGLQASELWEVLEDPRGRLGAEGTMPERQEGHLLKKRKWPLKGWHKVEWAGQGEGPDAGAGQAGGGGGCGQPRECTCVYRKTVHVFACSLLMPFPLCLLGSCSFWAMSQRYFVLEDGILHYATTRQDVSQGPCWGLWDECGPRMLPVGRGLLESTRAGSHTGSHSGSHTLLGEGSWARSFSGPSTNLSLKMERVRSPVCRVVILVRAFGTVLGTKISAQETGALSSVPSSHSRAGNRS